MKMKIQAKVIPMEISHIDEVYEIEKQCFSVPWSKDALEKEVLENNLALYFSAVDENSKVIGYAGMWHIINEGHITNIAVDPELRRCGIGQLLLDKIISIAYEKEMIGITLECRMNNEAAQRLYTKNGFKPEGIRKNYYTDTHEDAIIMWKTLI